MIQARSALFEFFLFFEKSELASGHFAQHALRFLRAASEGHGADFCSI